MADQKLTEPVYTIETYLSTSEPATWEGFDTITNRLKSGWVVLWQHHEVFTGTIKDGVLEWLTPYEPVSDVAHIVRVRAFDDTREYHFWRNGSAITGRLRWDGTGEETACIDTNMVLRNIVAEPLKHSASQQGLLCISTRNYIGYHPLTGQVAILTAVLSDSPLFKITSRPCIQEHLLKKGKTGKLNV